MDGDNITGTFEDEELAAAAKAGFDVVGPIENLDRRPFLLVTNDT